MSWSAATLEHTRQKGRNSIKWMKTSQSKDWKREALTWQQSFDCEWRVWVVSLYKSQIGGDEQMYVWAASIAVLSWVLSEKPSLSTSGVSDLLLPNFSALMLWQVLSSQNIHIIMWSPICSLPFFFRDLPNCSLKTSGQHKRMLGHELKQLQPKQRCLSVGIGLFLHEWTVIFKPLRQASGPSCLVWVTLSLFSFYPPDPTAA